MSLDEYLKSINKARCNDCEFNTNEELKLRPIILIPSPNKLKIMLISNNPTHKFFLYMRTLNKIPRQRQVASLFVY